MSGNRSEKSHSVSYFLRLAFVSSISLASTLSAVAALFLILKNIPDGGMPPPSILTGAGALLLLSMFLDFFDGPFARILGVSSSFGRFLDLFCDVVSNTVPPAGILLILPITIGGTSVPFWMVAIGAAFYMGSILLHYATVAHKQVSIGVTRFDRYQSFAATVMPSFLAGWLFVCAIETPMPFSEVSIGSLGSSNTIAILLFFVLGSVLIALPVSYPRIPDYTRTCPWPYWLPMIAIALYDERALVVYYATLYTFAPIVERLHFGGKRTEP